MECYACVSCVCVCLCVCVCVCVCVCLPAGQLAGAWPPALPLCSATSHNQSLRCSWGHVLGPVHTHTHAHTEIISLLSIRTIRVMFLCLSESCARTLCVCRVCVKGCCRAQRQGRARVGLKNAGQGGVGSIQACWCVCACVCPHPRWPREHRQRLSPCTEPIQRIQVVRHGPCLLARV